VWLVDGEPFGVLRPLPFGRGGAGADRASLGIYASAEAEGGVSDMPHTPGPLRVRDRFYIGVEGDPFSLAEVKSCNTVPASDVETHEANARLFAAAPELLAACKMAIKVMDLASENGFALNMEPYFLCRNAIQKAEGTA